MVVEEVEKNTWRLERDSYSSYLLEGEEKALLINSLKDSEGLMENVSSLTKLPLSLINTSAVTSLLSLNDDFSSFYMNPSDGFIYYRELDKVGNIKAVFDGDVIDLGGRKIRVISFPGVTPGSIVLLDYSTGALFSGLSIVSSPIDLSATSSDIHALLLSLRRLMRFMHLYDIIYPSIGKSPIGVKTERDLEALLTSIIRKDITPQLEDGKEVYSSSLLSVILKENL